MQLTPCQVHRLANSSLPWVLGVSACWGQHSDTSQAAPSLELWVSLSHGSSCRCMEHSLSSQKMFLPEVVLLQATSSPAWTPITQGDTA